jgi:hypothetical protein
LRDEKVKKDERKLRKTKESGERRKKVEKDERKWRRWV